MLVSDILGETEIQAVGADARVLPAGGDGLHPGEEVDPSMPWAWVSPNSEAFWPPKLKYAMGTGIGTLMPTMPTSTSFWKRRAAPAVVGEDGGAAAVTGWR